MKQHLTNQKPHENKIPSNSDEFSNSSQTDSQQLSQQEEQSNYQTNFLNDSQQLQQQQQSLLKSIYQLFNMYVVEYVDSSTKETIKMHFNEEEYKRIFVQEGGCYPASYDATTKQFTFGSNNPSSSKLKINPDTFLANYFNTENATLKTEKIASHLDNKTLYYYSTKETPSTKQQKGSSDILAIEVNFNIAYNEKGKKPGQEEFNKNILSCYIKIQSGKYRGKYIKFTPEMKDGVITIKRADKLYSYGADMKEIVSVDYFSKLKAGDLPKLEFKINNQVIERDNSQQVVGNIETIFHSSPAFNDIKTNTTFKHQPSSSNVNNPNLGWGTNSQNLINHN